MDNPSGTFSAYFLAASSLFSEVDWEDYDLKWSVLKTKVSEAYFPVDVAL